MGRRFDKILFMPQPVLACWMCKGLRDVTPPKAGVVLPPCEYETFQFDYLCSLYTMPVDPTNRRKKKATSMEVANLIRTLVGARLRNFGPWVLSPWFTLAYHVNKCVHGGEEDDANRREICNEVWDAWQEGRPISRENLAYICHMALAGGGGGGGGGGGEEGSLNNDDLTVLVKHQKSVNMRQQMRRLLGEDAHFLNERDPIEEMQMRAHLRIIQSEQFREFDTEPLPEGRRLIDDEYVRTVPPDVLAQRWKPRRIPKQVGPPRTGGGSVTTTTTTAASSWGDSSVALSLPPSPAERPPKRAAPASSPADETNTTTTTTPPSPLSPKRARTESEPITETQRYRTRADAKEKEETGAPQPDAAETAPIPRTRSKYVVFLSKDKKRTVKADRKLRNKIMGRTPRRYRSSPYFVVQRRKEKVQKETTTSTTTRKKKVVVVVGSEVGTKRADDPREASTYQAYHDERVWIVFPTPQKSASGTSVVAATAGVVAREEKALSEAQSRGTICAGGGTWSTSPQPPSPDQSSPEQNKKKRNKDKKTPKEPEVTRPKGAH